MLNKKKQLSQVKTPTHQLATELNKNLQENVAGRVLGRGFFNKTDNSREVMHRSLLGALAQMRVFGSSAPYGSQMRLIGGGKSTSYRVISTIPKRDRHNITNKLKQRSLKRKHKSHRLKHKSHRLKYKSHRLKYKSRRRKYKSRRRKH